MDIKGQRKDYPTKGIRRHELDPNPFVLFDRWYEEAERAHAIEVNAMALATATFTGRPSCRTILMKHFDEDGLIFYTNTKSRKAQELEENPYASATFFWHELVRQICIEGRIGKITDAESRAYFATRPRGSQIGAWASSQDAIIPSRDILEKEYTRLEKEFEGNEIPLPPYWRGYRMIPTRFEFWQGRKNRLHDRFQYTLVNDQWNIDRLSP